MTTIEKVAYLKGLFEGMEIDESTKEGKLLKAVVDVLGELAEDPASQTLYISNSACPEDAQFVADEVKRDKAVKLITESAIAADAAAEPEKKPAKKRTTKKKAEEKTEEKTEEQTEEQGE